MNYTDRLNELNEKLEREGLTEAERAEIYHISTLALLKLKRLFEEVR